MFGKCRGCGIHIHNDIGYCNACAKRLGTTENYSDIFDETRPDAAKLEFYDPELHKILFRIDDLEDDISEVKHIQGYSYEEEIHEYNVRLKGLSLKKLGISAFLEKSRAILGEAGV